jgi:hypothetical protein
MQQSAPKYEKMVGRTSDTKEQETPSTILARRARENYGKKRAGVEGGDSGAHASGTAESPASLPLFACRSRRFRTRSEKGEQPWKARAGKEAELQK